MSDPFAPFPAAAPARFPRTRLGRAGLDEGTVGRLETEYAVLDAAGRAEFDRYVSANPDGVIRDRFAEGVQGVAPREPGPIPTYEELNDLTIDVLEDRIRAWNSAHPGQHLAVSGRKGELIGRLLDAYEQERQQPPAVSEPVAAVTSPTPASAEQVVPTAPTATTPEGAPAQTADAVPGAGIAPSTSTEE